MTKPSCMVCGKEIHLLADQSKTRFVCAEHITQVRNEFAWGARYTTFEPFDTWMTEWQTPQPATKVQISWTQQTWEEQLRRKDRKKAMVASNKTQAEKEGKEFARQFKALIGVPGSTDFETISDFAAYYAQSVIGYTDAERANGWTKGFIAGWLKAETRSSGNVDLSAVDPVELALALLQRKQALETPALPEKTES